MILFIQHVDIEGPGTLGYFFKSTDWDVKTAKAYRGDILPSLDECDAIFSLGGFMNAYEEEKYPFLAIEDEFLKGAIEKAIPTIGICLGAQLLAKSRGVEVRKAEQEEVGWYKVNLTAKAHRDSLFKGLPDALDVFQWHADTFEIPKEACLLATSRTCRNQAIRIGECAWGLQFHPEVTLQMIEDWINFYEEVIDKNELIDGYLERQDAYYRQSQMLYQNFATVINKKTMKTVGA